MFLRSLALALITCSALAEDQQPSAAAWLNNMIHAMKTLNYQGTVVFVKNGQLDTMVYRHSIVNGVEQERLSSLNSPLREVTRKSSEVSCFFKETSQKIINHHPIDSSFIINLPSDSADLDKLYTLSNVGQESIAMLPAQIVEIKPVDQLRYARKIWIETQHYLPLKTEVYNPDGEILEQVVFTDLKFSNGTEVDAADSQDNANVHTKHIHASQAEPLENAPFILKNWPAGFKTVFFIRNSLQASQKAVDHLLISDGFSTVSVYLEPKTEQGVQGLHSLGMVNSYSKVIADSQITVLGEVPAQTVETIAQGIVLR